METISTKQEAVGDRHQLLALFASDFFRVELELERMEIWLYSKWFYPIRAEFSNLGLVFLE